MEFVRLEAATWATPAALGGRAAVATGHALGTFLPQQQAPWPRAGCVHAEGAHDR